MWGEMLGICLGVWRGLAQTPFRSSALAGAAMRSRICGREVFKGSMHLLAMRKFPDEVIKHRIAVLVAPSYSGTQNSVESLVEEEYQIVILQILDY